MSTNEFLNITPILCKPEVNYGGININGDGSLSLTSVVPRLRKQEIEDFNHRSLFFYRYMTPENIPILSVRGATSIDVIIDPNIYPDDRVYKIVNHESNIMDMLLLDSHRDKICAIRSVGIEKQVQEQIEADAKMLLENGVSSFDITSTYNNRLLTKTPQEIEKEAEYIGKSFSSILTKNLIIYS